MKKEKPEIIHVNIRETFKAQLPIVAAILASTQEEITDWSEVAEDAIALVEALEMELDNE